MKFKIIGFFLIVLFGQNKIFWQNYHKIIRKAQNISNFSQENSKKLFFIALKKQKVGKVKEKGLQILRKMRFLLQIWRNIEIFLRFLLKLLSFLSFFDYNSIKSRFFGCCRFGDYKIFSNILDKGYFL